MQKLFRPIHQSFLLVSFAIGVILGVVLGVVFRINFFASGFWLGFTILLFVFAYLRPAAVFVVLTFVAGMVLAFFRVANELKGESYIKNLVGETVTLTGTIVGDPESDVSGTKLKLNILDAGSIYISARYNPELMRGDLLTVSGKLSDGFGTYAGYMYRPNLLKLEKKSPPDPILAARDFFAERIKSEIDEPEVNLGLSYLLGMKANLDDELSENLRLVGLVHIVVASGAHLSILVEVAKKIFGKISRFAGLLFSVLFILFFMALVGFTPSILRAGLMSLLTIFAWYVGRRIAPWRLILLVAAFTLVLNPMFIINLGWLLSFASYAGIMLVGPKLTEFFYGGKKPGFVGSTILTTLSATLMTLPITLYFYGTFSLISIVANLIILPTLSYAMGLVFLTGVFSGVPIIATVVSFLATKLLSFHIGVVNFFGSLGVFLVEIPTYEPRVFLLYLGVLVIPVWSLIKNRARLRNYGKIRL